MSKRTAITDEANLGYLNLWTYDTYAHCFRADTKGGYAPFRHTGQSFRDCRSGNLLADQVLYFSDLFWNTGEQY